MNFFLVKITYIVGPMAKEANHIYKI